MLCEQAIASGASLFLNQTISCTWSDGAWRADGIASRFLVDAAGRHGSRSTRDTHRNREDALLSIAIRVWDSNRRLRDQRTWIEAAPAGWWYSTPLPDGSALVMFFTGAEVYRESGISIDGQLQRTAMARAYLQRGAIASPRIVYVPTGLCETVFGENWILVGDNASSYDPLSGRGVLKALRQGEAAAQAINMTLRGNPQALDIYAAQVFREFDAYSQERTYLYSAEHRWASHPFWQSRARNLPRQPKNGATTK
jgi:flavin-dependent dehydrogenase